MNRIANRMIVLFVLLGLTGASQAVADEGKDKIAGQQSHAMCPVMADEQANLAISTETEDGPVYFCCAGCVEKFEKNSAKYADKVSAQRKALSGRPRVQLTCPMSGDPIDKKAFVEQDGQKVYFCCTNCVEKYKASPEKYATKLANSYTYQTKCPVMGGDVDPTSFTQLADGRKIYFCCDACESKLFGDPSKYSAKLESQGYRYDWSKIKKADSVAGKVKDALDGAGIEKP